MHTRTKAISAFHPSSAEPSPSHHADKSTPNTGLVKPKIATLETGLYFNRMPRFSVGFLSFSPVFTLFFLDLGTDVILQDVFHIPGFFADVFQIIPDLLFFFHDLGMFLFFFLDEHA